MGMEYTIVGSSCSTRWSLQEEGQHDLRVKRKIQNLLVATDQISQESLRQDNGKGTMGGSRGSLVSSEGRKQSNKQTSEREGEQE